MRKDVVGASACPSVWPNYLRQRSQRPAQERHPAMRGPHLVQDTVAWAPGGTGVSQSRPGQHPHAALVLRVLPPQLLLLPRRRACALLLGPGAAAGGAARLLLAHRQGCLDHPQQAAHAAGAAASMGRQSRAERRGSEAASQLRMFCLMVHAAVQSKASAWPNARCTPEIEVEDGDGGLQAHHRVLGVHEASGLRGRKEREQQCTLGWGWLGRGRGGASMCALQACSRRPACRPASPPGARCPCRCAPAGG